MCVITLKLFKNIFNKYKLRLTYLLVLYLSDLIPLIIKKEVIRNILAFKYYFKKNCRSTKVIIYLKLK